jgi:hypothetical protein
MFSTALLMASMWSVHLPGDGADIGFVAVVEPVAQGGADDPRRRRGHKGLGVAPFVLLQRGAKEIALALGGAEVGVLDLGDRLGCVHYLGGATQAFEEHFQEVRVVSHVLEAVALAGAPVAFETLGDIGLKAHPGLLAVVYDIDSRADLAPQYIADALVGQTIEFAEIDRLPVFLLHQELREPRAAGQASDVGRQNAIGAGLHGGSSRRRGVAAARREEYTGRP